MKSPTSPEELLHVSTARRHGVDYGPTKKGRRIKRDGRPTEKKTIREGHDRRVRDVAITRPVVESRADAAQAAEQRPQNDRPRVTGVRH
jgi:hypothetical protein